jgi:hypothetical protein
MNSQGRDSCRTTRSGFVVSAASGVYSSVHRDLARERAYKVVGELKARQVGVCVFKVNDHKLLVLVCRQQQGGLALGNHAQNISILCLSRGVVSLMIACFVSGYTYVVVGEHQTLVDLLDTAILLL